MTHPLVRAVRRALQDAADPAKAPQMQAYMKSAMPYRGVSGPEQRRLWRALFSVHLITTSREWQQTALALWRSASYREERYAAIALTDHPMYAKYRTCIEPNLDDREFFIRKAIGWALRQYARIDMREVSRYVAANRPRLSPLSVREALKHA